MSDGARPTVRVLQGNVPVTVGDDRAVLTRVACGPDGYMARVAMQRAGVEVAPAKVAVGDTLALGGMVWTVTEIHPSEGPQASPVGPDTARLVLTAVEG